MQLNIMFISSNYPPRIGGPATTVPKIAKELSRNNKVSVITFIEKNTKSFEQDEFKLYRSPTFYFFGFSNPVSVGIRTALISIFSRIIAFKENPFIIHAQDNHISAVAALFVKYTSLKKRIVIMKYAGDLTLEFSGLENKKGCSIEEIFKNPTPKQKLLISFQGALFRHSNFVHAQNDYQKSILAKVYKINPKKIIIIPNPVDLTIFTFKEKRIQKNRFEILAVSRLVPWKGYETLITSMELIVKQFPFANLTIIGDGEKNYVQSLKELIEKKHLKERIIFNGKIQNSLLPKYFHEANVFVQPSLYEPFGITALEAISTGTPIVASRTGGLVELVQDKKNGFLCEPNNSNDLAKKVLLAKKVFTKNSTHSKIINKFEITKVIKRLNAFYAGIKGGNA